MTASFFQDYLQKYQPFKPYWNYEDGCVLLGCIRMFEATGSPVYADFVLNYLAEYVRPDGTIPNYPVQQHNLDSFNSSKALFFAERLTGDPRYAKAIRWQAEQLAAHPRTKSGMIWHKGIYPHQVWIDGVYMAAPFYAEYAAWSGQTQYYEMIGQWFLFLCRNLRNEQTGLYYHALDESRQQRWADPQTGRSASHWLRGEGWFLMALTDTLALLPESEPALRDLLSGVLADAVQSLLPYQAENGLFYQVIDRGGLAGNYTETSGSLMVAYAMMCGAAQNVLPQHYFTAGSGILDTVRREKLRETPQGTVLTDICSAAGLGDASQRDGSAEYYLSEPLAVNDPKGVGVLMMAEAARQNGIRSSIFSLPNGIRTGKQ